MMIHIARRWNYVVTLGMISAIGSLLLGLLVNLPPGDDRPLLVPILIGSLVVLAIGAYDVVRLILWPSTVELTPDGLVTTNRGRRAVVPWERYRGTSGGDVASIDYLTASGARKQAAIGMWRANIEVVIHDYAASVGRTVPIRPGARHPASPMILVIYIVFLLVVAIVAATSALRQ